ncbi:alpha-2-macroglobulin family protein [Rhizobium hidalgonense]|uniref:Alpha-2-macroglobulin family protein n=1 Tax=Rhizobium hidalgonense TaxID=1538159 RepID=A0AAJ2GVA3_9HYPH|nr:alpha-2-macroglobulin family protein [Rhizobium hidalgonense]MDR9772871.1 alpha-2-macroglobulin family protein [Rhizobium hidalgonense]MDR9820331.1 alpha-2-macroglobulin family protein [Rhizobium hidalgonense]
MSVRSFFAFVTIAFFSTIAVGFPAAAAETKRDIQTIKDADFFGFDLRTEQNVSLDQCKTSCIGDKSCKAFTYNPKVKWCFLKSDFKTMNAFPGAIAGKIVETAAQKEPDLGAAPRLTFLSNDLIQQAHDYKDNLALTDGQQGQGVDSLTANARLDMTANNLTDALIAFHGALSITPDDADLWLETARAAISYGSTESSVTGQAVVDALNGYELTRTKPKRAEALSVLATALERNANYRPALDAYKASLALIASDDVQTAYVQLKATQGFRITEHTVDADSATPRACVTFSEALIKTTDYTPFVTLNGAAPKALETKDKQICVEGLTHGETYKIGFRTGLPSSVDEPLDAPVSIDVYIKDRSQMVRFTGDSFVLPSTARRGIPIVSVNMASANLKLYRIGDRAIAPLLTNSQFLSQLDGYSAQNIEDQNGELVWQGSIDIANELNKDIVTSFPVDEALPERKPGIYVMTATGPNGPTQEWDSQATQWFLVSDIGVTTYAGTDGLNVFTRSLASAKPIAGVELQLLAKNNEVLGTATTDENGRATFTAGLIRGTAALTPAVITAKNGASDYVFLDMTRAGFDLSDRGVTGRAAPGAIDVLTFTERGIYRAGETVHAQALARDTDGNAIENLPLTFIFSRPDGVEDRRIVSQTSNLGGYSVDFATQENAMRGTWTMNIYTDPKGSAIASKSFLVDDFVPDRTDMEIKTEAKEIGPDTPATITIAGKYLYGAPAAGLTLEGNVVVKPTRESAAYKGFLFGLADEEASEDSRLPIDGLPELDENGEASTDLTVGDLPATTQLLNATVYISMQEAGGRAIERSLVLPVKSERASVGIKPEFSDELPENSIANFTVIGVDANGQKQESKGLRWKFYSLNREYQWYREGTAWKYEPVYTAEQVANGSVDATMDGGKISVPVKWGRYRLEVESPDADGPTSSVEFDAGWFVASTSTETPDGLEIALDKDSYKIGDTAKLKVTSRYGGELMVTAGTEKLVAVQNATMGETGGEVDIPVTADWGAGAYVTATLFRPGDAQDSHMPMRSIGIKWLKVDPEQRALQVKLDTPEKMLPRGPLDIGVQVAGAGANEDAYVTVAAVDVGILNLTRYEAPNPEDWYFGQRQLGLEIRDLYGRLIDGSLGATGKLRTGGDGGAIALQSSPPTQKLVAFFSGPVKLDADGKAHVSFDIPQFNGTARVMAVAWSKSGVGHGVKDVIIRDPVVVTASLPKFMAPGDKANLRLDIANTDAPAGDYKLQLTGNDAVGIEAASAAQTIHLEAGAKSELTLSLIGKQPGAGSVSINLSDAAGLSLDQTVDVPVRPSSLPITERRVLALKPGAKLTVDKNLLADSVLPGASISVNVTRSAAFDIPALLMTLDRYPFGCAEQTTSRALPLLYLAEVAKQAGIENDDDVHKRVQDAIYRVLSYQASAGSFGLWGPDSGDVWLDSYVTDFLTRAREMKYDVPERAFVQALENLQNTLSYTTDIKGQGDQIAYAVYVLARNKKAAISDLRYYADTMINDFPTPLAKAHIAAALALYGDAQRSKNIFLDALQMSQQSMVSRVNLSRTDYGTILRDGAAILELAAESRPVPPVIPELSKAVAKEWGRSKYKSTQEETWMLLAARAIQGGDDDLKIDVNGAAHTGAYMASLTGEALADHPLTLTNQTSDAVSAVVTTVAAPAVPLPAGGDGFLIERSYYTLDGEEANVSEAKQNERYVVVIHVREANDWPSRIVITDLLPAGFEIDNPNLVDSAQMTNFDWIGEISAAHTEFRYDRFVAAFNRAQGDEREFNVAYVVRAVTPGTYDHPAATVEDMYRPELSARTATGKMEVVTAQ